MPRKRKDVLLVWLIGSIFLILLVRTRLLSVPKEVSEVEGIGIAPHQQQQQQQRKPDARSRVMRILQDQLIVNEVYTIRAQGDGKLSWELREQGKQLMQLLADVEASRYLPRDIQTKITSFESLLQTAKERYQDCNTMVRKLRAKLQAQERRVEKHKQQEAFLSQVAAQSVPKGLHCLAMRLTLAYYSLPLEERELGHRERLEDNGLHHYALFSDNVIAASVVINSAVANAKEPHKHVFHLVTDKLHYGAMKMWFISSPPGNATVEVQNLEELKWLNSSYSPALRQAESEGAKNYYFSQLQPSMSDLKYRNPKYLFILNHLRFYLPQLYPKLDKILFLDEDVVVQKDLTPLWSANLNGEVIGAVETCGATSHRYGKYLDFSNPLISENFQPNDCGWAYGMNIIDLRKWKEEGSTEVYHKWQNLNENRTLWKLGTLPVGLITFHNLMYPLEKEWHVLGLGYNPKVTQSDILNAAVIHYNGNMKPWLDIALPQYKYHWTRYLKSGNSFLQECSITETAALELSTW